MNLGGGGCKVLRAAVRRAPGEVVHAGAGGRAGWRTGTG